MEKIIIKSGKEMGIEVQKIEKNMKSLVAQYRKAAKEIYEKGYYIRGRKFRHPREGHGGHYDCYVIDRNGEIKTLFHDTSYHRAMVIIRAIREQDKRLRKVSHEIWENYITNGYMTRYKGLFGKYGDGEKEKIRRISRSHADYMGHETGQSASDHENRMMLRR